MENCLVTQLKGVVSDDNLEKLGVLTLDVVEHETPSADSRYLMPYVDSVGVTIKIVGDGYFMTTYGGPSIGKSYTFTYDDYYQGLYRRGLYISNNNCKLEIPKYNFDHMVINSIFDYTPISKFDYTKMKIYIGSRLTGKLTDIPLRATLIQIGISTRVSGAVSDVRDYVEMESLSLHENQIHPGLFSSLGKLTKLVILSAPVSGSIEDFVTAQREGYVDSEGTTIKRETCDGISCSWLGRTGQVTFNGATITNKASSTLSWTEDTITYDGETIDA